jgi:uncharacterized membrane protein YgdD (TMEM256/DUF423 family)
MNNRLTLLCAALLGGLAVMLGAFGAHALKPLLVENGRFDTFELATRYQFYHALALLGIGILQSTYTGKKLRNAALLMLFGVVLFSGSLYMLALSKLGVFGPVTPVGGVLLMAGWVFIFLAIYSRDGQAAAPVNNKGSR